MRVILALVAALFVSQAAAQERIPGIEQTIQSQVDAFLAEDAATAFTFASPNIKRLFGTPERFGMMVKNGYPMVWNPSEVKFLELRRQGPFLFQKVLFIDQKGAPHVLEYNMLETEAGWQIDGVQYLVAPPVGA
ncbi:uncharacterized protein DUF4864 [Litoreibacter ponti]|uniref:Uncharacterized protein DUF4864 n=1 Tax=Litoreibacter ponti TaxID=1510457 RepID=A0A2T6BFG1_9RHOB|nr:DUF4864 domain-containing protein [Litoreibacter ponti]PTX54794.1 uncharacterized protein DUF4864 [Litoreibacter ponti]